MRPLEAFFPPRRDRKKKKNVFFYADNLKSSCLKLNTYSCGGSGANPLISIITVFSLCCFQTAEFLFCLKSTPSPKNCSKLKANFILIS